MNYATPTGPQRVIQLIREIEREQRTKREAEIEARFQAGCTRVASYPTNHPRCQPPRLVCCIIAGVIWFLIITTHLAPYYAMAYL
jgi:hypothetical protein